jgi:outer membrane protein OmpA-like peptidoglycan-associated protein
MQVFLDERHPNIYQQAYAQSYIGDAVFKITKEEGYSIDFWKSSWALHPTYEVALHLLRSGLMGRYRSQVQNMYDDLPSLTRAIPNLSYVLGNVYLTNNEINKAKELYSNTFMNNFGARNAYDILNDLVDVNLQYMSDYNWVDSLLKQYQKSFPFRKDSHLLFYKNHLYTGSYTKALDSLKLYEKSLPNANKSWFQPKYDALNESLTQITQKENFYTNNPFLKYWEQEFGNSISIQLEFAVNSAKIKRQYFKTLNNVAKIFKRKDSENYSFQLEGHTDSQGSADLNKRLSQQRAQAIKDYFVNNHNIDGARLMVKGHGEVFPVATNATDKGRRQNRRVELMPMGRINQLELFPPTKLSPKGAINLSPDGHTLAVSSSPIELWDLRSQTKIRDLGRGSYITSYSPNGRYLITASNWTDEGGAVTHKGIIYDVKTGLIFDEIFTKKEISHFAWSEASNKVAFTTTYGILNVYSLNMKKILKKSSISSIAKKPSGLAWSHQSNQIYTSERGGDYIRVWDGDTLKHIDDWFGVSWVHGMALSADHNYLLAFDNQRVLSIFNINTGDKKQITATEWGSLVYPHPTKPWVLLASVQKPFNIGVYNYITAEKVTLLTGDSTYRDFEFSNDGKLLYQTKDDSLLVRDGLSFEEVDEIKQDVSQTTNLTLMDSHDLFLLGTETGTQAWDLNTAKRVHEWDTQLKLFTTNKINYGIDIKKSKLYRLDLDEFLLENLMELPNRPDVNAINENWLLSAEDGQINDNAKSITNAESELQGELSLIDLNNRKVLKQSRVGFVTAPTKYDTTYQTGFHSIAVDKALGLIAYTTYWQDGYGQERTYSKQVTVLDAKSMTIKYVVKRKNEIKTVRFNEGKLEIFEGVNPLIFDPKNGEYIEKNWDDNINFITLATVDESKITTNSETWISIGDKGKIIFPDNLQSAVVSENKKLVITLLKDGKIELYRLSDQKKLLTLLSRAKNEWLAYTPEGHYQSSLLGAEGSSWSFGDLILPFNTFADKFYKPRIIEQQLNAVEQTDNKLLAQLQEVEVSTAVFRVPYKVVLQDKVVTETSASTITLNVALAKMQDVSGNAKLQLTVNGQKIGNGRGFKRESLSRVSCPKAATSCENQQVEINLDEGKNIIGLAANYEGVNIDSQTIMVSRKVQKTTVASSVAPRNNLWFFGIGISDYQKTEFNLNYAHADAKALAKTLKAQEGKLYKQVNTKLILNEGAIEKNIKVELNRFLRQASSEDTIIVFAAGHGTRDSDGAVYFMTHDSDLREPYTGLNVSFFKDFLHNRPINQKALFWMDICHAGGIGGEWGNARGRISSDDAIRMLAEGTGVAVMASSTGMESSLEGPKYGHHGAFTQSILGALAGKADSESGNKDGVVSVLELQTYVSSQVPKITGGRQHPTSPSQIRLRDFPLVLN